MVPQIIRRQFHGHVDRWNARCCERDSVDGIGMGHRSHDGDPVGHPGDVGQMLANIQAGKHRWNRLHRPADFHGSIGLHVKGLELAVGAVQVEQNAMLGFAETRGGMFGRRSRLESLEIKELAQPQSTRPQPADLQQVATTDPVAQFLLGAQNAEHQTTPTDTETLVDMLLPNIGIRKVSPHQPEAPARPSTHYLAGASGWCRRLRKTKPALPCSDKSGKSRPLHDLGAVQLMSQNGTAMPECSRSQTQIQSRVLSLTVML